MNHHTQLFYGENFFGTKIAVTFSYEDLPEVSCSNASLLSLNTFQCIPPPGIGTLIKVSASFFLNAWFHANSESAFNYPPPTITHVAAPYTPTEGGTNVTINGLHFGPISMQQYVTICIGSKWECNITQFTSTFIVCILPPGEGANQTVSFHNRLQNKSFDGPRINYEAPQILDVHIPSHFSPNASSDGGGHIKVTKYYNFGVHTPAITIGLKLCEKTMFVGETLNCLIPKGVGANLDIVAIVGGVHSSPYISSFSYSPPSILYVNPSNFSHIGGTMLTVTGKHHWYDLPKVPHEEIDIIIWIGNTRCKTVSKLLDSRTVTCITPTLDKEMIAKLYVEVAKQSSLSVQHLPANESLRFGRPFCPVLVRFQPVPQYIVAIAGYIAFGGITLCNLLLIILVWKRETFIMKTSSPTFCYLIVFGAILAFLSIYFYDVTNSHINVNDLCPKQKDSKNDEFKNNNIQNARAYRDVSNVYCCSSLWLLSSGYTLAYGCLIAKNWRILNIFFQARRKNSSSTGVSDCSLLLKVGSLVGVNIFLLAAYNYVAPPCNSFPNGHLDFSTFSTFQGIVAGIIGTFWLVLLIAGLYIVIQSRTITYHQFSERHQIGYSIYATILIIGFVTPMSAFYSKNSIAKFLLHCLGVLVATSVTLACMFVPKLIKMAQPEPTRNYSDPSTSPSISYRGVSPSNSKTPKSPISSRAIKNTSRSR